MLRKFVRLNYSGLSWGSCSSLQATRWSTTETAAAATADEEVERKKLVNKLLYRSKQRGFLELDLLVGLWAEQHIPQMDTGMLQQFSVVLKQENPDLFKWLTGQQQAPQELQQNPAYQALSKHVAEQLAANSPQEAQAAAGKEWVRGWDDYNKSGSSPAGQDGKPAAA
ncbi:hypothetical protein OEZ85_012115 [Tetradesmus obliquus]|uniref:Succinate dehydrogenase assembly factor 2, mitochondrial n=1 Tax=Tetradesmus obliquus TaxID=3088 RepID=A0ABY8TUS1_TETOB|nr:hypothetical protein OEZ85_012115 [Tetradesmus obliquus]